MTSDLAKGFVNSVKTPSIQKLRRNLAAGRPAYGLWVTLESPSITEMAVALGVDWIVIDAEHGHLDWKAITEHLRATVRSDTVALVRIAEGNAALVKRALDVGADGVVVPWMESAEQLRQTVAMAKYPPAGIRGIGAERATGWGQCFAEHAAGANDHVLVVPIIESVRGGANIREMLEVPGVDLFFLGPADYSSSAGYLGQWQGPGVAAQLLSIKDQVVAAGKYCGVIAASEADVMERRGQGFGMIGLGLDAGLLIRSLRRALATVGRDRQMLTTLLPSESPLPAAPLPKPPESFRPDRDEVMNDLGSGQKIAIQPGVVFEALVGAHNGASKLTTGIVEFAPAIKLAYHTHPCTESITLVEGEAIVEVEGRRYRLSPLDNVVIPPGVAHGVENASADRPARFHIAFPTAAPSRELVEPRWPAQPMPDDSTGPSMPGAERVNRHQSADRFEAGDGATFIDFFNEELTPGVEMSGGWGVFRPGGRLPAHIHDFDESICITDGESICVVEGRRYSMSGYSTALQPRGRVHYFINESERLMAMIWVYAGPRPERIVVDEANATAEGNPWK